MLFFSPYFHHTDEDLIKIQHHALADTVDTVNGTTANLHAAATDVVKCLTSDLLISAESCKKISSLCLDQRMTPAVP